MPSSSPRRYDARLDQDYDRTQYYQDKLAGLEEGEGAYVYWCYLRPNVRNNLRKPGKGYQVRIAALGDGCSKYFAVSEYGSRRAAREAALLYRAFAISQLPNRFPTKDQFIRWLMRRHTR